MPTPYRLDLTVSVLRRLSSNMVDVLTPDGEYVRALSGGADDGGPAILARVAQPSAGMVVITIDGHPPDHSPDVGDADRTVALVRRCLGMDRDLGHFDQAAARMDWLSPLALRMRGVKPPRYPTLWEACVNAIVFQQVSLLAATAIMRRLILALSSPVESEGTTLYPFPRVEHFLEADDDVLRAAGLSRGKLATLRRTGEEIVAGALDERGLEESSSPDAAARLRQLKGIGPWTAALILLRGLGRLDVFPVNDTSVARNMAMVSDSVADVGATVEALRPQQGMLYYHLLLARLEARGDIGRPSDGSAPRRRTGEGDGGDGGDGGGGSHGAVAGDGT
ncbi:MAG: DNA-3-methyladenine glycosylase family protein, partial [Gemmatimonadaceae bacterium]